MLRGSSSVQVGSAAVGPELGCDLLGVEASPKQRIIYTPEVGRAEPAPGALHPASNTGAQLPLGVNSPFVDRLRPGPLQHDLVNSTAPQITEQPPPSVAQSFATSLNEVQRQAEIIDVTIVAKAREHVFDLAGRMTAAVEPVAELVLGQRPAREAAQGIFQRRPSSVGRPRITRRHAAQSTRAGRATSPDQLLVNSNGESAPRGSWLASMTSWAMSAADWIPETFSLNSSGLDACRSASS